MEQVISGVAVFPPGWIAVARVTGVAVARVTGGAVVTAEVMPFAGHGRAGGHVAASRFRIASFRYQLNRSVN
jgi:hypothetical protein